MHRKLLLTLLLLPLFSLMAQVQQGTFSTNPATFSENDQITVTVSGINAATWGNEAYIWAWYFDGSSTTAKNSPTNGTWTNSDDRQKMTKNADGSFSFTFTPATLYNATGITRIGLLAKAKDGTGDKKTQDYLRDVGGYQLVLTNPVKPTTIVNAGSAFTITATASANSDFVLKRDGAQLNSATGITQYSYQLTVNNTASYTLEATANGETLSESFTLAVKPTVPEAPLPAGMLDGLNLDPADPSKATLVLYAPGKEFVHLIGSFNDWQIDDAYLMRKDTAKNRFWFTITGLNAQTPVLYQYLVDLSINIADPYSTTLLDPFNDQYIDALTYPDLPAYPAGKTTEMVSVFETGKPAYNWTATNSFSPPAKEDLVIYELHIRDFDELHSFDAVRNRLDYLQGLGVNAIEFMPLNEFDGNDSWGYNPAFHMALDKYYGTPEAFKALVDECHARGMAVIVDVVYNHATGQHPYVRLWNASNGTPSGAPTADNPFFNTSATHSYSVFNDFNHQRTATQDYVKRTLTYWIEEFHVDGFRWDLTKGFTQNCASGGESCTNNYQQDRVDVLKAYADTQWAADPDFYVIFEHLGGINEESQWSDYRLNEGKGIMLWNKQTGPYNEATMGFHQGGRSNFSGVSYAAKGFSNPAAISYMESHDEERLMYKNLSFGNATTGYSVKNLNIALKRMQAAGAFFFSVPGPKMIWQFGELGYDVSIDQNGRTGKKPIRWEYFDVAERRALYDSWSDLILLKTSEPIFRTSNFTMDLGSATGLKTIHLTDNNPATDGVRHLTIIGNFGLTTQEINPNFQSTGVWYDWLNGNLKKVVLNQSSTITLAPGEFRIYGDRPTAFLPDLNFPDQDSDGVADTDDLCPDTPLGSLVNVEGCTIFSLPAGNFKVAVTGETCADSQNGSISVTVEEILNYGYTLTGNGLSLSGSFNQSNLQVDNLSSGSYTLCFTVDGEDGYSQCFELQLTAPEPLNVQSKTNTEAKITELELSGATSYTITLNGLSFQTGDSQFTLSLQEGWNTLSVTTSKDCQGSYQERIYVGREPSFYPNPAEETLWIHIPTALGSLQYAIYNMQGQLLLQGNGTRDHSGAFALDVSKLQSGLYLVSVSDSTTTQNFKILKK